MGLRCLLGHEYANREVEREREERGDEVVVTYRTVETCERCGERRIVSENKEVRPVRNPEDDAVATGLGGGVTPDPSGEAADDDAAPPEDAETDDGVADPPVAGAETDAHATAAEADDDAEATAADDVDDAVILDDDEPTEDRGHGEWPAADVDETADARPETGTVDTGPETASTDGVDDGATVVSDGEWPDPAGEDEGFDAEPTDGDAAAVSFGGGLTPEADAEGGAAAAANGSTASVAGKQFVAAEEVEPVGEDRHTGETEFYCPNCGFARAAGESSMRAGDICPDCHEGYIGERER